MSCDQGILAKGHNAKVVPSGTGFSWDCRCGAMGDFCATEKEARDNMWAHCTSPSRAVQQSAVNHPPHYQTESGLEAIDVIEAFGLNFRIGSAVKYLLRAGKKGDRKEDLEKAIWYIRREVEKT